MSWETKGSNWNGWKAELDNGPLWLNYSSKKRHKELWHNLQLICDAFLTNYELPHVTADV